MRQESISSYAALNSMSSNASTMSIGSSGSNEYGSELIRKKNALSKPKFEPFTCRALGLRLEINDRPVLCGRKLVDEHYEYLIEICVQEERWFILRRYSRIRQLHEQMSLIYPSLNCLVFPVRQLFNRELLNRQLQLEHYLKCFLEVLLNDSHCPIYQQLEEKPNDLMASRFNSKPTVSSVSNSSSLNSFSSTSSPSYYQSMSTVHTSEETSASAKSFNKEKLASFCPFFEQTQADRAYLSKVQLTQSCYFDTKNTSSFSLNHVV